MIAPIAEEKLLYAGKTFRSMVAGTHAPPHRHDFLHCASLMKSYRKRESKALTPRALCCLEIALLLLSRLRAGANEWISAVKCELVCCALFQVH